MMYVGYRSKSASTIHRVGACGVHTVYQYLLIRERKREGCFKAFLSNNWVGAAIYAGILVDDSMCVTR